MLQLKLIGGVWKTPSQKGYSPTFPKGFISIPVKGGFPVLRAVSRKQPVAVTAVYELGSNAEIQSWNTWYYYSSKEGSVPFEAQIDLFGKLEVFECQLTSVPQEDGYTGEYCAVTLDLLVFVDFNRADLAAQYEYNSMFRSDDELLAVASLLPYSTDPLAYIL